MQKGIIVKRGLDVLAKRVYAGTFNMDIEIVRLQKLYPDSDCFVYESDQMPDFVDTVVNAPVEGL